MMCVMNKEYNQKRYIPSSRIILSVKEKQALILKERLKGKPRNSQCLEDCRRKISESKKGKPNWRKGVKGDHLSIEDRAKIKEKLIGKKRTEETKKKLSEYRKGKPAMNKGIKFGARSEEIKQKIRESYFKNIKVIKCPYCSKESTSKGNMVRHHFDNCKFKK